MKLKEVEVYEVDVDVDGRLVKNSNNDDTGQQQQQQQQQRRQQQTTTTTSQPASQLIDGPDITHRFVLAYSLQYSVRGPLFLQFFFCCSFSYFSLDC